MQTTEMPAGQLSGAVLLYVNPEPLSVEAHGKLGIWRNQSPYRFASTTAALPLQVTEFGPAALTWRQRCSQKPHKPRRRLPLTHINGWLFCP